MNKQIQVIFSLFLCTTFFACTQGPQCSTACTGGSHCIATPSNVATCACGNQPCMDGKGCSGSDQCITPGLIPPVITHACDSLSCDAGFFCVESHSEPAFCTQYYNTPAFNCGTAPCPAGQFCREDKAGAAQTCVPCVTEVEPNDVLQDIIPTGYFYTQRRPVKPNQATKINVCGIFKNDPPAAGDTQHLCATSQCATKAVTGACPTDSQGAMICKPPNRGDPYCPVNVAGATTPACVPDNTNSVIAPTGGTEQPDSNYIAEDWDTFFVPCRIGHRYVVNLQPLDSNDSVGSILIDRLRIFDVRATNDGLALNEIDFDDSSWAKQAFPFVCPMSGTVGIAMRSSTPAKKVQLYVSEDQNYTFCSSNPIQAPCSAGTTCTENFVDSTNSSCSVITAATEPAAKVNVATLVNTACFDRFSSYGAFSAECFSGITSDNKNPYIAASNDACGGGNTPIDLVCSDNIVCPLEFLPPATCNTTNEFDLTWAQNKIEFWGTGLSRTSTRMAFHRFACLPGYSIHFKISAYQNSTFVPAVTILGVTTPESYSTCFDSTQLDNATKHHMVEFDYACDATNIPYLHLYEISNGNIGPSYVVFTVHPVDATTDAQYGDYLIELSVNAVGSTSGTNLVTPIMGSTSMTSTTCTIYSTSSPTNSRAFSFAQMFVSH